MKKIGFFWSVLLLNFASFGQTHSTDIAYKSENTSAAFPGGDFELMIFINDNIQYPKTVAEKNINDKCVVRFMVTAEGELKNIEIIKNISECPECDTEAIRLIQSMPKWEPATKDKSPIRTHMNLSITFKN